MSRQQIRNQRGSVLVMVVVISGIMFVILAAWMTHFSSMARAAGKYMIMRENLRVGGELAKVVAKAYETGQQNNASGVACPGPTFTSGSSHLCFGDNTPAASTGNNSNCTYSQFGWICIDLTAAPQWVASVESEGKFLTFDTNVKPLPPENKFLDFLIPKANAQIQMNDPQMPAEPTGISNTYTPITCTVAGGLCRACGTGQAGLCYQIRYCSVESATCITKQAMPVMIIR